MYIICVKINCFYLDIILIFCCLYIILCLMLFYKGLLSVKLIIFDGFLLSGFFLIGFYGE